MKTLIEKEDNNKINPSDSYYDVLDKSNLKEEDVSIAINENILKINQIEEKINLNSIYKILDFDPNGKGESIVGGKYSIEKDGLLKITLGVLGSYFTSKANSYRDKERYQDKNDNKYLSKDGSLSKKGIKKEFDSLKHAAKEGIPSIKKIEDLNNNAEKLVAELFPDLGSELRNNHADAFRHAYFNYRLTEMIGELNAKKFGDAHEISYKNKDGERLMDLYNNQIGRELYALNKTKGEESAIVVIMQALKNGLLREVPFRIKD